MLLAHLLVLMFLYGKMKKIEEYQTVLRDGQTCHAFDDLFYAAAEGCTTDHLCDMLEILLIC